MAVKPIAIKVTAGIVGVGGAAIIGHQTYKALQTKSSEIQKVSNRDKLISQKYEILGTEEKTNDGTWQAILDSYKNVIKSKEELAFVDFDGNDKQGQQAPKALDTLKTKCEEALNSKDETLLNKARKWCIVPTRVEDALKGRRILKLDDSKDEQEDKADWDEKIKSYTKLTESQKIEEIKFAQSGEISTPSKDHRNIMRTACKKLNEKKSYEGDYEKAIDKSKEWCSIKQSGT